ncbi:MAG: GDSL-type esterase/lipase family protein [Olivibacter sp.]|nr:GDSL-type esterase/lipase family protein [Olivibacter sp. UJ_SKK_5.1]
MKKNYLLWALLVLFKLGYGQSVKPFSNGDRVVFAGNSITEAGLYENYIWLYYITHFPDMKLQVFNAGIGGDVAGQIYDRLPRDIMEKDPSVLIVTFGMNDSKYFEYQDTTKTAQTRREAVDTAYANFLKIEEFLKGRPGIRKIIMSSSPYDETMRNEKNYFPGKSQTMEEIAGFQQDVARKNRWEYVDLLHPMLAITEKEQGENPAFTLTGPDRIHPGSAGHFVMAYLFLKEQGLAGKAVADVSIDVPSRKVEKSDNAKIKSLKVEPSVIRFDYLSNTLPYPIDTLPRVWENSQIQRDALSVIPFTEEFNQERLMVKGLKAGNYALKIDGEWIGAFSATEWAKGINLAEITHTPQYKQALELMELNRKHRELEAKLRNYYWVNYNFLKGKNLLFDDSERARDTIMKHQEDNVWLKIKTADYEQIRVPNTRRQLEKEMQFLREEIYRKNKPKEHQVTISAI